MFDENRVGTGLIRNLQKNGRFKKKKEKKERQKAATEVENQEEVRDLISEIWCC